MSRIWKRPRRLRLWRRASCLNLMILGAMACITYLVVSLPRHGAVPMRHPNHPMTPLYTFLDDLALELHGNEPNCSEVWLADIMDKEVFDPSNENHQTDWQLFRLNDTQFTQLQAGHQGFVSAVERLAPRLPFDAGTKGIVMTANMEYLGVAMTSLMMLRRRGSVLPAQVFVDGADEDDMAYCDRVMAVLQARCINMDDYLKLSNLLRRATDEDAIEMETETETDDTAETHKKEPLTLGKYQFKVFALIFSSFQEILFLDADVIPVHNPDFLFDATTEPYASHGLVTWPDSWLPTVAEDFYRIVGQEKPWVSDEARCSEAGILLYDKARHADSLLLAAYYNFFGPRHYYPLLSQGAWGQGDKETFLKAAQVLGKPAWPVRQNLEYMSQDPFHDGTGMMQHDPIDDFRAWQAQESVKAREEKGEQITEAEKERLIGPKPRWLFAHLNRVKIDARRVAQSVGENIFEKKEWVRKDEDEADADVWENRPDGTNKRYQRAWGPNNATLARLAGYDVEKALWDEIIPRLGCDMTISEECAKLTVWYRDVFAGCP
jgi:alpha 1,2-mannosyltransferase